MNWIRSVLLPLEGSTFARGVDNLYLFLIALSIFFFVLIAGLVFYSVVKFRRRGPNDITPHITHHFGLELTWTIIPTILVIIVFFWGFHGYMTAFVTPGEALEIQVTGKKWLWQFEYPNGTRTVNEMHAPLGRPVKLIMSSEDVIHNFFIPTFRTKHDVVPNRYTEIWFNATVPGKHMVECTAYCGKGHSNMYAELTVEDDTKFKEWLDNGGLDPNDKSIPPEKRGQRIYESRGCNTCHSLDGVRGQGPSWKGIWGQEHKMVDGRTFKVDENYIRTSILQPQAMIVQGFEGIMPTYQGLMSDRDIEGVIAFIKAQK